MRVCQLHLVEAAGENISGSKIDKAVAGAAKGLGGAVLALFSIIYHGLTGKAVAAGTLKPSKAANAYRIDRKRAVEEQAKEEGVDPDNPKPEQIETLHVLAENEKRYLAIAHRLAELEIVDLDLAKRINKRFERQYRELCYMFKKEGLAAASEYENKMLGHIEKLLQEALDRIQALRKAKEGEPEEGPEKQEIAIV